MLIKATSVQFNNVQNWTDGPLKPTTNKYSGTPASVITSLSSVISSISNLADGEVLQIIVTAEDDSET